MIKRSGKIQTVKGYQIAPPRLTPWAFVIGLGYVALPLLGGLFLLDVAFYYLFAEVFDSCYGLLCFMED